MRSLLHNPSKLFAFALLFFFTSQISAQDIPIGTWRNHLAYLPAKSIALAENEIYCATENGLFFLDKNTNSLNTLAKIDGLSESIIQKIDYHSPTQTLVIVYENSTIDLIQNQTITEIAEIKNANIAGSKKINHIFFYQNLAYLSADFGVVVLDLNKKEIKDTYQNLGANGTRLIIRAATVSKDSLVLATEQGVLLGSLQSNLLDFNNWQKKNMGLPNLSINGVVSRNDIVYALIDNLGLYKYAHNTQWTAIALPNITNYNAIQISNNQVSIALLGKIFLLDNNETVTTLSNDLIVNPLDFKIDANGKYWMADFQNSLVTNINGNTSNFYPNGVARSAAWRLTFDNQQVIGVSGGFDTNYNPTNRNAGFYQFVANVWTNFNAYDAINSQTIPNIKDLLTSAYNSKDKNWYFASFGDGILVKKEDNSFEVINQSTLNSPLETDGNGKVKIAGLAVDNEGNLWVSNHSLTSGKKPIHVKKSDGTWQSFTAINSAALNPLDILIDFNGYKWIRLSPNRGGGIWILDDKNNRQRYLSTTSGDGNLPNINVNAIAEDLEGQIWIGTDRGVAVIFSTSNIFDGAVNTITPIFDARPLLRTEKVNGITIDKANRKWIATDNGLWLFNADGSQQISYFNTENSPLLSDKVLDTQINPVSGEVFIATDKGIQSYRGTATEASSSHENVKIFPNPVRPDFTGLVGISGLVENATVKITDVSGRLFYETKAQGGTATWNLQDYNGVEAKTGIYLIFSTNFDGSEVFVGKIAVVRNH